MSKVIDINAYLPADIKVKTVTGKVYSMPGSIPVITVTGFEAWLNKTGKLVDDQFNKPEGKKPLRVDEVNSMFAQLTADGWKLARDIISIKQPKITMSEVKEALPSLEAITFFLRSEEHTSELQSH